MADDLLAGHGLDGRFVQGLSVYLQQRRGDRSGRVPEDTRRKEGCWEERKGSNYRYLLINPTNHLMFGRANLTFQFQITPACKSTSLITITV